MGTTCLITTQKIKELTRKFPGETEESIKGLVSLWQKANNKNIEDYPTGSELNAFRTQVRNANNQSQNTNNVEIYSGNWTRDHVANQTDKVFLFGDNTDDRTNTHHIPTATQAVIRGLDNAIGIDTKKDRGTNESSYFTDDDFEEFKNQVDEAIQKAINSGKTIVIPENGIGTGKAQLEKRAPKLFTYLQDKLKELKESTSNQDQDKSEEQEEDFNFPTVVSVEEQRQVDLDFDPKTRRDRVSLIARFFSNELDLVLEETRQELTNRLANAESFIERYGLREELDTLDRVDALGKHSPKYVFDRVLNIFKDYVNDSEENQIQTELSKINASKGSEKYTDEQKLAAAKKRAEYKRSEYIKIINNFKALAEESTSIISQREKIIINIDTAIPKANDTVEDDPNGESETDSQDSDWSKEETIKDGWMTNFRSVSSHESLSQNTRKIISAIPKLNYKGKYELDDLGNQRYLDGDYVHAVLIDKLRNMISAKDMIPMLEELSINKPWVKQLIKTLQKDELAFSQFYQDFRKDFTNYWVQKRKTHSDGTFTMQTIAVNKPEGIYYLLDSWRDNYESGDMLDEDSIYDKNGTINIENARKGLEIVNKLSNAFNNLSTEDALQLLDDTDTWESIIKVLRMLSVDTAESTIKTGLTKINTNPNFKMTDPIKLLLPQLNIIFSGLAKEKVKTVDEEGQRIDLINVFGGAYNSIAKMIADVTDDAIESCVRENNKSYYAHTNPNYLGKLMKYLKNVHLNQQEFDEFIEKEYGQYDWFRDKDGNWRCDWLKQLVESQDARDKFDHKVVLNSDKITYTDWDSLDHVIALLTEYWGDPENNNATQKYAWYYVPILSDAPSAEFIKFKKYTDGMIRDEAGNFISYQDIIAEKMVDLVSQEYDRIMLVRERAFEFKKGNKDIVPIDNYDIKFNKDGSIKSIGGGEFKFIPALNNLRYENGKTFIDKIKELSDTASGYEVKAFIMDTIKTIMEEEFEKAYVTWDTLGLLEENDSGKYKNLPFVGQSSTNKKVYKALNSAKAIIGNEAWTRDMETLMAQYNNNAAINDAFASKVFREIEAILEYKNKEDSLSNNDLSLITKSLTLKNNAKEALREYFWNSTFATSQIIELTTTDLAFYKNVQDFAKRYKEVHAPSLKLNTLATFHGERVGRDWERTIYLADYITTSDVIGDVEQVLDEKVTKGEMTKIDRDFIISQYKKVNVADAQAYRSLSSYRSIMVMSGQWSDELEDAYNNLRSGTWSSKDFNIIMQTKKPYVYTQINNDSGLEGHSGIKTPVQHKNSEFLLLAIYGLVAGNTAKSGKMRAINQFMEDNNIDVVQFISTTKVGGQGVIDINDVTDYKEVYERLEEATKLDGVENPNVVHKVSYEDYGIQTATPEHIIDRVQLVGTQIRKLITADIAEDAEFEINGKKLTKKQWWDLYNEINTENILQSFIEVSDIFKDPKKVEKILLEEVRGNERYGIEMVKACTLDENGRFNLPLFDPVQSQRVQTLINSVIRSRITKQKIKGGACIQVSNFGYTDDLHIVFEGEGKNKRIKYMECYMPAYSREFYEPFMNPDTHTLDVNKLPEELRKLIGYRVPTEDKYSMVPLMIKGFLPQQNGSAIMLPSEITTLSGSDFDRNLC
jgi:hypothetical protein